MEIVLKLYTYVDGVNDTPFPNSEEQAMFTFTYDANRMGGAPTISATVKHRLCLDDLWTDNVYAEFRGEKYFVMNTPSSSKDNEDERYEHDVELLSEREVLNHVYFIDAVQGDSTVDVYKSNSTNVNFFGDVNEFVSRLNACLSYQHLDYNAVLDDGVTSEDKQVSFEDKYILEALQEIFNVYEIPYYFVGKVIHVGYTENTITYPLKYGFDEALLSISKENANYAVINKIKGQGSSDNIPYYYPNESDDRAAIEAAGKKWITPMSNLMPSIYRESEGAQQFYEAKNNTYPDGEGGYYEFENEYSDTNQRQGTTDFEDIKPTIEGMTNASGQRIDMFSAFAYDENDNDEKDEEGNYIHSYFFAKLRKFDGENGFNLFDHAIEDEAMTISFTSGVCGACTFEIGVGEETQKNIVQVDDSGNLKRDENGNVLWENQSPQDRQNDTKNYEVWIALKKEDSTYGIIFPNASQNLKPSVDDTFVILGINLPTAYITAAEKKLEQSLIKYMWMNNTEKFTFSIKFSRIFFAEHPEVLEQLNENSRVLIEYNGQQHTLYVDNFSYKTEESSPLPEIEIDLVDTLSVGQNSLQTQLDSVKQDILSSIGGGDFLKQGLKYFLRKDTADVAKGRITFRNGLDVGSYTSDISGGTFRLDEEGKSYLEVDKLFVRMQAIFEQLQIKKVSYIGGEQIVSAAGMEIKRVEEFDTYYRCYATDTDEQEYDIEFTIDDQAISKNADSVKTEVDGEVSYALEERNYWRLVVGVGTNYVDLSKTDCDTTMNGVPKAGDEIIQLGHRTDTSRQNAIIFSSISIDAPSIKLLKGISEYSLTDKELIIQGFDSYEVEDEEGVITTIRKAVLKVYGDLYVGKKDEASYMNYDSEAKLLEIKGTIRGSQIEGSVIRSGYTEETTSAFVTKSGLNGEYDETALGGGISYFSGGDSIDRQAIEEGQEIPENAATALIRFDGTGYFAKGNLWWDADGTLHADPLSFFVGEETVGDVLALFQFVKDGETTQYVIPKQPFLNLEVKDYVKIGSAYLRWDAENKAVYVVGEDGGECGFYTNGFLSAKGMDKGSESGGTGATTLGGLTNVGSWADQTATYDRILVQLSGNSTWTEKKLSEIGGGLDEEQLSAYLTENNYAKKTDIPSLEGYATEAWVSEQGYITSASLQGYATESWVLGKGYITSSALNGYATQSWVLGKNYATTSDLDARIDALVNGAPAAYDTLKEIADVLQGNVDSIGDIITTLGTKADKTITISAGTGLTGGGSLSANRTISLKPATTTALGGIIVGDRLSVDSSGKLTATYTYTHPSATATTISAAAGKVLSAITVNNLGHVTSVAAKTLAAADIPNLSISKISGLQEELDSKLDASVLDDLFEKVEISTGVYAIRAKYGLFSNEFISAKGMDEGEEGGSGSSYLSDLLDVSLTSLAANDLLKWNGSKWVNVAQSSIVPNLAWGNITGKPTTLSGYGITDAYKVIAGNPDDNKGMCAGYYANVGSYASFVQSNFGGQLSFGAGGILKYRGINNNYAGDWKTVLDTSNYASTLDSRYLLKTTYTASDILTKLKTVDGTGSGLDADTLDGYEASKFYANGYVMFGNTVDATNLDENTYYPVTFQLGSNKNVRIECLVSLSSNSKPSWATHQSGFSVKKIWETNGNAWGTINVTRRILASDYLHATSDPVRGIGQMLNSSNEYVYVRGGGRYFFYVSHNIKPVLHTSAYTASQQTVSPTTTAPAQITRNVAFITDTVSTAEKLSTTSAGSATRPVYFANGIPVSGTYTFGNASGNAAVNNGTVCTNLNADKLDGLDVSANGNSTGIKKLYVFSYAGATNTYIKVGTLPTPSATGSGTSKAKFKVYGAIDMGGREEATWEVIASTRSSIYVNSTLINGSNQLKVGYVSGTSNVEIWVAFDSNYITKTAIEVDVSENFTLSMTRQTTKPTGFTEGSYRILAATDVNGNMEISGALTSQKIYIKGSANSNACIAANTANNIYFDLGGIIPLVASATYVHCGNAMNGQVRLGSDTNRWSNLYSINGNFSGAVTIGNGLNVTGNIIATGAITAKAVSDIRLKTIIQEKVDYRKKLLGLGSVVDFYYNDKAIQRNTGAVDKERHIGLIYQQAKTSKLVNFCHEDEDGYGSINYLSTDYLNLIAGALQQTIRQQETIEQRVSRLERENKELRQQLNKLSA